MPTPCPRMPLKAAAEIREFLDQADPRTLSCAQAADALKLFAEIERLGHAGKVLFAERATDSSSSWVTEGHRSAASWLAETSRCSMSEAITSLETAKRLGALEKTRAALRRGELSSGQLKEIASAAERDPAKETELIQTARNGSLKQLKEKARGIRLRASSAADDDARYRAIHAARYCRHWSDDDGAFRVEVKLTPDRGALLASALEKETDVFFDEARKRGDLEPSQAYRADALVALVTGEGKSCGPRVGKGGAGVGGANYTVVMRADAAALRRGYAKGDEICQIAGVGGVPVSTVREVLGDAFVKIVIRDAVDVKSVCHVGRTIHAHVRTALEDRDPTCVLCDCAFGLEIHHWRQDYAVCRTTSLDGLARVCKFHHDLITYDGYKLEGGPGRWKLAPPPGRKLLDSG